jgi:undecaprenyl-diphosphatase
VSEWEALLLGVVQGLTEFLPISSSGHLILVPWVLDFDYLKENPDFNKTFDVALHAGTLVAVLTYFRTEIVVLVRAALRSARRRSVETPEERLAWLIAIATVPAVLVGGVLSDTIEEHLGEPWQIAIFLFGFALLLYLADRQPERREMDGLRWQEALGVGVAQAVALAPGTSRSGITITAGRFLGLTRDSAARFSFLMLTPVVAGAVVFKGAQVIADGLPPGSAGPLVVGVVSAALSGFVAIWGLLRYVRSHDYTIFVWYRVLAAATVIALIASGLLPATF